jgi:phage shock protein A
MDGTLTQIMTTFVNLVADNNRLLEEVAALKARVAELEPKAEDSDGE